MSLVDQSSTVASEAGTLGLPEPSNRHATCAWCGASFANIVDVIDHVDAHHLLRAPAPRAWEPSPQEVRAIVAELRPLIRSFIERDARRLETWANQDRVRQTTAA